MITLHKRVELASRSNFVELPPKMISGFRRNVAEIGALLGYYAASSSNPLDAA
jgi:hypothetical protein